MNEDLRDNLRRLLVRALVALPFYGAGFWLMSGLGIAFYGGALMVIGACIIAFPAAELLGRPLMSLYYPTESGPSSPNYSIPAARVKQGRYEEAMQEYAAIVRQYPTEVLAYTAMIEIAFKHLHNRDRANAVYRQGMEALTSREHQAKLHQLYMAYRSWAENPPH
jgi:hypothetical protein